MKLQKSIIATMLIALLTACSANTPKGSDNDVKDLALEIAKEEIRNQLAPVMYARASQIPVGLLGIEVSYKKLETGVSTDTNCQKAIDLIKEAMQKTTISIENIRIDKIDDNLLKSWNSADLIVNNEKNPIKYTAQVNSDGDLYVEMTGLK